MSLRVCMIGCGSFARQVHGPAQQRYAASHPDVFLAGCSDANSDRARDYAAAFGFARSYPDAPAMLAAEQPHAVVIAVPPALTCPVTVPVLEQGFPVLVEKPPGLNISELDRLLAAEREGRARAQVAFNRHYMPVMRQAREILAASFPPAAVARIEYDLTRFDRWDEDFSTTAVHAFDGALLLARSPLRIAEFRFRRRSQSGREAFDVALEAECACGTLLSVNVLPVAGRNQDTARVHAVGQSLLIRLLVSPQSPMPDGLEHWRGDRLAASFEGADGDPIERLGIAGETAAFLDAVRSGAPLRPGFADCHQRVELMEAMRARRTGPIFFHPQPQAGFP